MLAERKKANGCYRHSGTPVALVVLTFLAKLLIGYLLAGKAGLTLFGPSLHIHGESAASQSNRYLELLALSMESVKGHALGICLMFGVPIAVAINASFSSVFSKTETRSDQKFHVMRLRFLVNLCWWRVFFRPRWQIPGHANRARLHMRTITSLSPCFL